MEPEVRPTSADESPLTRSMLGLVGTVVLVFMVLACVLTLPWTLGNAVDPANPGGPRVPRINLQALEANLLPPSWSAYDDDELARYDAYLDRIRAADPDGELERPFYLLGTDQLGRDFFVRCLAGGGISLGIGIAAAAIAVLIGTAYGMIAGYAGGRTDAVMMRIVDILYGLPYILLVVLLAVAVDGLVDRMATEAASQDQPSALAIAIHENRGVVNVVTLLVAIGGVSWLTMARVIRGQVLSLKNQQFMEACRAIGVPISRQFTRHLLPNLLGPIIVYATLTVPQAILQESFLSFLGIGIQPPVPSWGNLVAEGLTQLNPVESRWWLLLWPCLLLAVTLLALNFIGEGLREAFDPRRRAPRA